jgi:uncharacterized protein with FMN-binding domain
MSRSSLLALAVTLALFGAAVITGNPPWGAVTGIAIVLTAAAMAAGALAGKSSSEAQASEQRTFGQKIPASLVTLSATAILVVYAAGYQRTRSAADQFDAQTARRQSTAPVAAVAAIIVPPQPFEPAVTAPAVTRPPAETQRSTTRVERPADPAPEAPPKPVAAPEPPVTATVAPPPAPANEPAAVPVAPAVPAVAGTQSSYYKDGTFLGWGRCRHGSIQASVAIAGGQIVATDITQCLTRYSCSWISNLPGQVVTRQSADVDYVSGATESTEAFFDAVSSALAAAHE